MSEHTNETIREIVADLLDQLRLKGFAIGVDTYIDALSVTGKFLRETPNADLRDLGRHLSPLLCRNRDEQHNFDHLFSQRVIQPFIELEAEALRAEIATLERTKRLASRLAWSVPLVIGLAAAAYTIGKGDPDKPKLQARAVVQYKEVGDSYAKDVFDLLEDPEDTVRMNIEQRLTDDPSVARDFNHTFTLNTTGEKTLVTRLYAEKYDIDLVVTDTLLVSPKVDITIKGSADVVAPNTRVTYELVKDDNLDLPYAWYIGDGTAPLAANSKLFTHVFRDTGNYTISVKYEISPGSFLSRFPASHFSTSIVQKVRTNDITIASSTVPLPQEAIYNVNPAWWLSLLAAALTCIAFIVTIILETRKLRKMPLPATGSLSVPENGDGPPYDIPFRSQDEHVADNSLLRKISTHLIKTVEARTRQLSLKESIRQTIRNAEFVTPVYKRRRHSLYYLVILDQEYTNSQQFRLFTYLVRYFIRHSVNIDVYYYNEVPDRVYKQGISESVSLHELLSAYRDSPVIVFSSGHSLIDYKRPVIRADYRDIFVLWEKRILVTPIPFNDWSHQENVLQGIFDIVPADIVGLLEIVRLLQEQPDMLDVRSKKNFSTYNAVFVDFQDIASIKTYLDNDHDLVQWLCALAVYPKIDWNVAIEIGKAVLEQHAYKINYTNLLKFARIKWMHEGRFTASVRLLLLKHLEVPNELKARATMLGMLEDIWIDQAAYSYEEKLVNTCTNSFILFAAGPDNRKIYQHIYNNEADLKANAEQFIALYRNNQLLDVALDNYVRKGNAEGAGETWVTPIMVDNKFADLDTFIDRKDHQDKLSHLQPHLDRKRRQLYLPSAVLVLILLSIAGLFSFKTPLAVSNLNALAFIDVTSKPPGDYQLLVIPPCDGILAMAGGDSIAYAIDQRLTVLRSGRVAGQDTLKLSFSGPIGLANANFTIGGTRYAHSLELYPGRNYMLSFSAPMCGDGDKDTVHLHVPQGRESIASVLTDSLQRLGNNVVKDGATTSSPDNYIEYYGPQNRDRAVALRGVLSTLLNKEPALRMIAMDSLSADRRAMHVWLAHQDRRDTIDVYYCSSALGTIQQFLTSLTASTSFYAEEVMLQDRACVSEVHYWRTMDAAKARALASRASAFLGQTVNVVRYDGAPPRWPIRLMVNALTTTILWVDDHPENNKADVDFFRENNIQVEVVKTNFEAIEKLNSKAYGMIITDVDRDGPEPCVSDNHNAGIELLRNVNFPKALIFVSSASLNRDTDRMEQAGALIPRANVTPNKEVLRRAVLDAVAEANTTMYKQSHNCKTECTPTVDGLNYTLYFLRGKNELSQESRSLLSKVVSMINAEPYKVAVNSFAYSGTSQDYNMKLSQSNLRKILDYLPVKELSDDILSYAMGDENPKTRDDCDRVEIMLTPFAEAPPTVAFDSTRMSLAYKDVHDLLGSDGYITLRLDKRPSGKMIFFSFEVKDDRCPSAHDGKIKVLLGEKTEVFSWCGTTMMIRVDDVRNGVAYFDVFTSKDGRNPGRK